MSIIDVISCRHVSYLWKEFIAQFQHIKNLAKMLQIPHNFHNFQNDWQGHAEEIANCWINS